MKLGNKLYRGTICCDIDGVLANFESRFCEDFGYDNRHLYSLEERYPDLDPYLIQEYVQNPDNYADLEPIFGGLLFTRQAKARGWYILLVTSRGDSLKEVTLKWLYRYSVQYHDIIFAKNKHDAILAWESLHPSQPVRIVVDDSVQVLQSLPEKYCVAWSQIWNFGYYPTMTYVPEEMKVMIKPFVYETPMGIWDKVGK